MANDINTTHERRSTSGTASDSERTAVDRKMQCPPASTKKTRGTHSKSRAGCHTCRRRKVKCDETKPHCKRCLSGSYTCDGYGIMIDVPKRDHYELYVSWKKTSDIQPRPTETLSCLPTLNMRQSDIFNFFRSDLIPQLAGLRSTGFWQTVVLPACYSEPAILHASLAISYFSHCRTRYKSGLNHIETERLRLTGMVEYNKAIQHVSKYLQNREAAGSLGVILITSVLFVVLELFIGAPDKAIMHFNGGRKLMLMQSRNKNALSTEVGSRDASQAIYFAARPETVEDKLINIFAHMDLQTTYFGLGPPQMKLAAHENQSQKVRDPIISLDPSPLNIPTRFRSVYEANQYLVILINECLRFTGHTFHHTEHTIRNYNSNCHRRWLSSSLRKWRKAYSQPFFTFTKLEKDQMPWKSQSALMLAQHAWLTVMIAISYIEVEEAELDCLLGHFTTIVNSIAFIFSAEGEGKPAIKNYFASEIGITPSLYWTAIKCRHPKIRRKALSLLEWVGGDTFWDPMLMRQIGVEILMLEEGPDYNLASFPSTGEDIFFYENMDLGAFVPLKRRISGATYCVKAEKQIFEITFKRKQRDDDGLWTGDFDLITVERPLQNFGDKDRTEACKEAQSLEALA